LADIRSSGKIENDADNIVSVNRDLSPEEDITEEARAEVKIILMKDREFGNPSYTTIYFDK
jgi:replicative DNA helicase